MPSAVNLKKPVIQLGLAGGAVLLGIAMAIGLARARTHRTSPPSVPRPAVTFTAPTPSTRTGWARDAVPAIDQPVFAPSDPGVASLAEDDWVIGLHHQGQARAYPLWILAQREIVNDQFGTEPVCITYCPLSATASVFLARALGKQRTFGNDGKLHECNLVLYDRESESRWYQLGRVALDGPCTGKQLTLIPAPVMRWSDWRKRHPKGEILIGAREEGRFFRSLATGPAASRFNATQPFAPVSRTDDRLPPMLPVTGFHFSGKSVGFPINVTPSLPSGELRIPNFDWPLTLLPEDGIVRIATPQGAIDVPLVEGYWFAWSAAHPEAALITDPPPAPSQF